MKFKPVIKRERKSQEFDINEPLTMGNKKFVVYDFIQAARTDTEIYPTLEKYGCIDKMQMDAQKVYADFTAFKDLRTMKDQQIMAQKMWADLPFDVRQHFNNNVHTFLAEGESYLKKQLAKETPVAQEPKETPVATEGANNG